MTEVRAARGMRAWRITVDVREPESGDVETTVATIQAPTAQQAIKALVVLQTNNARVIRVEIQEVKFNGESEGEA